MVKENQITSLVLSYRENEVWDKAEAAYMWARMSDKERLLKENLKARYNEDKAYELLVRDFSAIGVNTSYNQPEDTEQFVRDILVRSFMENCETHFRKEAEKAIPSLSELSKRVVFLLLRGGMIKRAEELSDNNVAVWNPYGTISGVSLTEEEKQQIRKVLFKLRVVDLDWLSSRRIWEECWLFPLYSKPVITNIERHEIRLPKVYLLYKFLE